MATPSWFDYNAYFKNKLAAMQAANPSYNDLNLRTDFIQAGYSVDADGMYKHFTDYGADEGVSPNALFNADQYVYNKTVEFYGKANSTPARVEYMWQLLNQNGFTPWEHYQQYGGWETLNGKYLNPSTNFDASAYMNDKLAQMKADFPADNWDMPKLVTAFQNANVTPLEHYLAYGKDEGLTPTKVGEGATGSTQYLGAGDDKLYGTSGNDYFEAGVGHLNDNDEIYGGGGYDTLKATLGSKTNFVSDMAVQPTLVDVEKVILQAQKTSQTTGSNLPQATGLDAERIEGMSWLQNDNSRAALTVEDVRTNSNVMTIEWSNTDPGEAMDYYVHFNNQNLKADGQSYSGTLYLKVMDTEGGQTARQPLLNNPYHKFFFQYTPTGGAPAIYELTLSDADSALWSGPTATYDTLVTAFQNAIADFDAANPSLAGVLSVEKGAQYTGTVDTGTNSWTYAEGFLINLTANKGQIAANNSIPGTGWFPNKPVPPSSGLLTDVAENPQVECPLIKTNIVLDNVARVQWADNAPDCLPDDSIFGSESGDMVVGAMADRGGVERFDVKVDRGSWLSSLSSTNETLRMITAINEDTNGDGVNGNTRAEANEEGYGQLFIGKQLDANRNGAGDDLQQWTDKAMLLSTDGVVDVKDFVASDFKGNINVGMSITEASYLKYMKSVDGTGKIDGKFAPSGDFKVNTGSGADVVNMELDTGIAVDNDFRLVINTGDGKDFVNFQYDKIFTADQMANLKYLNNNVRINTGSGDDIIKFWGVSSTDVQAQRDGVVRIDAGSGDDKVYVGQNQNDINAVFVFNTGAPVENRFIDVDQLNGAQPLNNDLLGTARSVNFVVTAADVGGYITVEVDFMGFTSEVRLHTITSADVAGAGPYSVTLTTREINRAIIKAIEDDHVLNTVLVGKDGAADSLIIESLYDSALALTDLGISFHVNNGAALALTEYATNYGIEVNPSSPAFTDAPIPDPTEAATATAGEYNEVDLDFGTFGAPGGFEVGQVIRFKIADPVSGWQVIEFTTQSALSALTDQALWETLNTATGINTTTGETVALSSIGQFGEDSAGGVNDAVLIFKGAQVYDGTGATPITTIYDVEVSAPNGKPLTGTDTGTITHNWVKGGTGDDVLVLNANPTADYFDTLLYDAAIGNDSVFNFDTGFDKINVRGLLSSTGGFTSMAYAANWTSGAITNISVLDNGGFAHDPGNNTQHYTVQEVFNAYSGAVTLTANAKYVLFVADQTDQNLYTVFQIENNNNNTLEANEIKLMGTIDFEDGVALPNQLATGDIVSW